MSSQLCRPFWECTGLIDRNHSKVKWKIYKVNSSKAFSFSSAYKLGNKWVTLTTLNSNLVTFCNRFFASLVQKLHPLFYNTLMLYAIAHLSWNPTSETCDICDNFFYEYKSCRFTKVWQIWSSYENCNSKVFTFLTSKNEYIRT